MILGKKRLAVRWFSICLIVLATVALAYLAISKWAGNPIHDMDIRHGRNLSGFVRVDP